MGLAEGLKVGPSLQGRSLTPSLKQLILATISKIESKVKIRHHA